MKKKLIALIVLLLIIIPGCNNKEKVEEKTTNKVNTTITDITNITENDIKSSYIYIKNNYTKSKDEKHYENLIYHIKYLQALGKYSKDNSLTILANKTENYLEKNNKKNKDKVTHLLNEIDGKEDKLIKEIYDNYLKIKVIDKLISQQTIIVKGDINDKNMVNEENINKAINYLNKHIQNPLKNDEILEKTIYYSLYLSNLGSKENNITKLGQHVINYLSTFDKEEKDNAINLLDDIHKNQKNLVTKYYEETIRNN